MVATLAAAALVAGAAMRDRSPAPRLDLRVARPAARVAPAKAAQPILRSAHFLDGPSPAQRWRTARSHIRR